MPKLHVICANPEWHSDHLTPLTGSQAALVGVGMNWLSAMPCVFVYRKYMVVFEGRNNAGVNVPSAVQSADSPYGRSRLKY